jgi:hypothetical protein
MVSVVGWAVVFAAMMIWEGINLSMRGSHLLTLSDLARTITRPLIGRWLFFALWLWFGWHYFIRGWTFLLQGRAPGGGSSSAAAKSAGQLLGQVVFPLSVLYAFFAGALVLAHRRPRHTRTRRLGHPGRWATLRVGAVVVIGGYAEFVAAIAIYRITPGTASAGLVGSAARDGAVLTFGLATPTFIVLTLAQRALHARRPRRHAG